MEIEVWQKNVQRGIKEAADVMSWGGGTERREKILYRGLVLNPGTGKKEQDWLSLEKRVRELLGYGELHNYVSLLHRDTNHHHIHIVLKRRNLEGDLEDRTFIYIKCQKVCRIIEEEYNFDREGVEITVSRNSYFQEKQLREFLKEEKNKTIEKLERFCEHEKIDLVVMKELLERRKRSKWIVRELEKIYKEKDAILQSY